MKKNKNKGFIATSILFGIVALLFITLAILLGNSKASLNNSKIFGNMLKGEITNLSGIKLNPNGGYVEKTLLEVDYNAVLDLPDATRNGYTFIGWYTNIKMDNGVLVLNGTKYSDVLVNTLYAQWSKNMYSVSINLDGGLYNGTNDVDDLELYYDDQLQLETPTREGYTFDGWELTGAGSKLDGKTFQMGYENATLKAKWKVKEVTLTVDPKSGTWEGSEEIQTFPLEYEDTKEIPDPVREGYTFTGWEYAEELATLNGKTITMGENDVLLEANWEINNYPYIVKHYQQAVDTDDYTLVEADTTEGQAPFGEVVIPPYNTYDGFQILGNGAVDEDGKVKPQELVISTDISQNLVEYKYARILYLLKINPNGGNYNGDLETYYKYGKRVELSIPTKTGYTFTNWTLTSGKVENNIFTVTNSDATITANWKANEYILTLEPNGGNVTLPQYKVTYDTKYGEVEEPVRIGYTFKGWSLTSDGKNIINADTVIKTASNHTLYAVWEANEYTITLVPRGGTVNPTTIKVTYGEKHSSLPEPTRAKHKFSGWFTDPTVGEEITANTEVTLAEDRTLYARWLPMDAEFVQYSNSTYTTCQNVACTLNELYNIFKK